MSNARQVRPVEPSHTHATAAKEINTKLIAQPFHLRMGEASKAEHALLLNKKIEVPFGQCFSQECCLHLPHTCNPQTYCFYLL